MRTGHTEHTEAKGLKKLSGSPGCFICDNNASNSRSLGLDILWDEQAEAVHIVFEPDQTWCGYSQVVHGGLVAAVLDEAMAWAVKQKSGEWALTADFHLRYKLALEPGQEYRVIAKVDELGRIITTQAQVLNCEGRVVARTIVLPSSR